MKRVLEVPSQKWCRVYGTGIELWNPLKSTKTITPDLDGMSGLRVRLSAVGIDAEWIYIKEEVKNRE